MKYIFCTVTLRVFYRTTIVTFSFFSSNYLLSSLTFLHGWNVTKTTCIVLTTHERELRNHVSVESCKCTKLREIINIMIDCSALHSLKVQYQYSKSCGQSHDHLLVCIPSQSSIYASDCPS